MYLGTNVKKLIKNGLIIKLPQIMHSRSRALRHAEARRKGRHMGTGDFFLLFSLYMLFSVIVWVCYVTLHIDENQYIIYFCYIYLFLFFR